VPVPLDQLLPPSEQAHLEGRVVAVSDFLPGALVARGPHWDRARPACSAPLRLARLDCDDGYAWAATPDGDERVYRIGVDNLFELVYATMPIDAAAVRPQRKRDGQPVTASEAERGAIVSRGPDWDPNCSVGGGRPGRIMCRSDRLKPGLVYVMWSDGTTSECRASNGVHELVFGSKSAAPSGGASSFDGVNLWAVGGVLALAACAGVAAAHFI
jgi:hypothetical protein